MMSNNSKDDLLTAIENGDLDAIRACHENGVDMNERRFMSKETPLRVAILNENHDVISLLADLGASPEGAIEYAIEQGKLKSLHSLIVNDADVSGKFTLYSHRYPSSSDYNKLEIVQGSFIEHLLLKVQATQETKEEFKTVLELLKSKGQSIKTGRKVELFEKICGWGWGENFELALSVLDHHVDFVRVEVKVAPYLTTQSLAVFEKYKHEAAVKDSVVKEYARHSLTNDHTLEENTELSGGRLLTKVFNFKSCRVTMFVSEDKSISPPESTNFSDLENQSVLLEAEQKLKDLGGAPPADWKKHLNKSFKARNTAAKVGGR